MGVIMTLKTKTSKLNIKTNIQQLKSSLIQGNTSVPNVSSVAIGPRERARSQYPGPGPEPEE